MNATASGTARDRRTVVIEAAVDIERPAEAVFGYCSDHTREVEWNPAMRRVAKITGFARHSDRRAGIAAAVVATESLVFAGNGFRCPLTQVAERLGADRGTVTDIYLPRWFARNLPAIHVPLIGLAVFLHARNLRTRR